MKMSATRSAFYNYLDTVPYDTYKSIEFELETIWIYTYVICELINIQINSMTSNYSNHRLLKRDVRLESLLLYGWNEWIGFKS